MRLYREALRSRLRSVGIGRSAEDLSLLAASDQAFILPLSSGRFDENLVSKVPHAAKIDVPGTSGWNQTVLSVLSRGWTACGFLDERMGQGAIFLRSRTNLLAAGCTSVPPIRVLAVA